MRLFTKGNVYLLFGLLTMFYWSACSSTCRRNLFSVRHSTHRFSLFFFILFVFFILSTWKHMYTNTNTDSYMDPMYTTQFEFHIAEKTEPIRIRIACRREIIRCTNRNIMIRLGLFVRSFGHVHVCVYRTFIPLFLLLSWPLGFGNGDCLCVSGELVNIPFFLIPPILIRNWMERNTSEYGTDVSMWLDTYPCGCWCECVRIRMCLMNYETFETCMCLILIADDIHLL